MYSTSLISSLLLAGGAFAQYGSGSSYESSSGGTAGGGSLGSSGSSSASMSMSSSVAAAPAAASTATSGQVMVHVVKVSNKKGDLTFEPSNLQAAPGSMVQFHFYPKVSLPKYTARSGSMG